MIGTGNNRMNNIINRRQQQQHVYEDINDLNIMLTPKPKYYLNSNNNINRNNQNNFNNMNVPNIRNNMNVNINRNNMNNLNNIDNLVINNNLNVKNNLNNQNNQYRNINQAHNSNISKAFMLIRNEFKKKDDRIKTLELKIVDLENKINQITKANNYNSYNMQEVNNTTIQQKNQQKNIGKNFTFAEKNSDEINQGFEKRDRDSLNKTPEMNYGRGNNPFISNEGNRNMNNNFYAQTKSANQYKIKGNNDNEFIIANKANNVNDATADGSVFTGNSSNFQKHSKNEVKLYLKEVKSKVDPIIFKEFIQNIKLLTNSKEKNGVDRNSIIEKVRILFGEQFKDLFIKFESILGFNNNN